MVPQIESVLSGLAVVIDGHYVATGFKENAGLIMGIQKSLRVPGRRETAHDLLSLAGRPMRSLSTIIETLMCPMIRTRRQGLNRFDVTAQFVCYCDPWLTKAVDPPSKKAICGLCLTTFLHENVDGSPEPLFFAIY